MKTRLLFAVAFLLASAVALAGLSAAGPGRPAGHDGGGALAAPDPFLGAGDVATAAGATCQICGRGKNGRCNTECAPCGNNVNCLCFTCNGRQACWFTTLPPC